MKLGANNISKVGMWLISVIRDYPYSYLTLDPNKRISGQTDTNTDKWRIFWIRIMLNFVIVYPVFWTGCIFDQISCILVFFVHKRKCFWISANNRLFNRYPDNGYSKFPYTNTSTKIRILRVWIRILIFWKIHIHYPFRLRFTKLDHNKLFSCDPRVWMVFGFCPGFSIFIWLTPLWRQDLPASHQIL